MLWKRRCVPRKLTITEKLNEWKKYVAAHPREALTMPEAPKDYPTIKDWCKQKGIPHCERCGWPVGQRGWLVLDFKPPHSMWNEDRLVPCPVCNGGGK